MKEGYKKTAIGVIPVEWEVVKLDSLGKIITGSTPKTSNQDFYLNGTRLWASPSDLGNAKEVKTTNTKLSNLGFEQIRVLAKRSILITCIGSTIGKIGIAYEEMSSNQQINAITCNEKNDPDFYYYVLFKIKDEIQKLAGTQAVPLLNKTDFSKIKVIQPPLKEQQKIADILSTSDNKIEAIATQIEKAETLKKGLLQKLLSEGIGHSEFKDSELGKIPLGWEVTLLDKVSKRGTGHTPNKKFSSYWNGGIKWVSLSDSSKMDNRYIYNTDKEISLEGIENSSAILHPANTVILVRDAGVGKSGIIAESMAVSQHFITWVCKEQLNYIFLYYWLQTRKTHFENIAIGSTIKTIGMPYFKKLKIPLPPLKEQQKIADILSKADEKIEILKAKKEKHETLKKGLLQKLLSGEVRV